MFAVVVMGGLGSIWGALVASLLIGVVQTASIALDLPLGAALTRIGVAVPADRLVDLWNTSIVRVAPVVPYALLILVLALRPRGLMGTLLEQVAERGVTILLVEQKLDIALAINQRLYVMGHGRIVFEGTPAALAAAPGVRREWLEV